MEGTRFPAITFSSSQSPPLLTSVTGVSAPLSSRRPTPVHSQHSNFNATNYDVHRHSRTSAKFWDKFYQLHQNKFFKDRHYLEKDWGKYFSDDEDVSVSTRKVILEVGCGAGNSIFPLVTRYPKLFVHACDFSPHAIALVKSHTTFTEDKINAFVCNVAEDNLCDYVMPSSIDVVTMIFMLSAVSPEKMPFMIQNLKKVLKPNGCVLLRDYAIGDFAQDGGSINHWVSRCKLVKLQNREQMISENFFFRGDGTSAFYFSEDFLSTLFARAGFTVVDMNTYCKEIENRSRNIVMPRRWIRAVFSML